MEFREVVETMRHTCLLCSPTCHYDGGEKLCPFVADNYRLCDIFTGLPGNARINEIEEACLKVKGLDK